MHSLEECSGRVVTVACELRRWGGEKWVVRGEGGCLSSLRLSLHALVPDMRSRAPQGENQGRRIDRDAVSRVYAGNLRVSMHP